MLVVQPLIMAKGGLEFISSLAFPNSQCREADSEVTHLLLGLLVVTNIGDIEGVRYNF